jgi:hypothetical protein
MPIPTPQRDLVTAVEFDLLNGSATETLRLCDVGPVLGVSATETTTISAGFRPCLYVPVEIAARIVSDGLNDVMPASGDSGGSIRFSMRDSRPGYPDTDPPLWQYLDMSWIGRHVRIYTGEQGDLFDDYELSYIGRVNDLTHDTLDATVKVSGTSIDLDDVLVPYLYDTFAIISGESGVPEVLLGKPLPELRGKAFNIPAILVSDTDFGAPLYYQVSRRPLSDITEVRVGGIPWDKVAFSPVAGQWAPILSAGAFVLGGITGGLDVRCDASSIDGDSLTTATLMTQFVTEAGGEVNEEVMLQLELDAPYVIGWWTGTEPINRLDAFNEIMASVAGWWGEDPDGRIIAGLYKRAGPIDDTEGYSLPDIPLDPLGIFSGFTVGVHPIILSHEEESDFPETDADFVLRETVASIELVKTLPPVWRTRVEFARNWGPLTSFADAVREIDQQIWQEPGKVAQAIENRILKIQEPRAVDLPLIRSLVQNQRDAELIRDRVASVFGIYRHIYNVKAYVDAPGLYNFAFVDYRMVQGFYRVLSVSRGYGSGPATIQIWG